MKGVTPITTVFVIVGVAMVIALFIVQSPKIIGTGTGVSQTGKDVFCPDFDTTGECVQPAVLPSIERVNVQSLSCRLPDGSLRAVLSIDCNNVTGEKTCYAAKSEGYVRAYRSDVCGKKWEKQIYSVGETTQRIFCNEYPLDYCYTIHLDGKVVKIQKKNGLEVSSVKLNLRPDLLNDPTHAYSIHCDPDESAGAHCYVSASGEVFAINKQNMNDWHRARISGNNLDADTRRYRDIECDNTYCYVAIRAQDTAGNKNTWIAKFTKSELLTKNKNLENYINGQSVDLTPEGQYGCEGIAPTIRKTNTNDIFCEKGSSGNIANCFIPAVVLCNDGLPTSKSTGSGWVFEIRASDLFVYNNGGWPVKYWRYVVDGWNPDNPENNLDYPIPGSPFPSVDRDANFGVDCSDGKYCYVAHEYGIAVKIDRTETNVQENRKIYSGVPMTAIQCFGDRDNGTCYNGFGDGTFGWFTKKQI